MIQLVRFFLISCVFVVFAFCGLSDSADVDYLRTGYLRPLRLTAAELQAFMDDIRSYVERSNFDASWITRAGTVHLSSSWDDASVSGSTLTEIFSSPGCPDPLRNISLTIHAVDRSRQKSIAAGIRLGPRVNYYWVDGSDKMVVYALEASILRFAKHNGTWIRSWFRYAFLAALFGLAYAFGVAALERRIASGFFLPLGAVALCIGLFLSLWSGFAQLFAPLELWKTSEVSFFERNAGGFAFFSLVVAVLGLAVALCFGFRSSAGAKVPNVKKRENDDVAADREKDED